MFTFCDVDFDNISFYFDFSIHVNSRLQILKSVEFHIAKTFKPVGFLVHNQPRVLDMQVIENAIDIALHYSCR